MLHGVTTGDSEWQRVVQRGVTNDNEWQQGAQRVTTSDNEWKRVMTNDKMWRKNENRWQRVM